MGGKEEERKEKLVPMSFFHTAFFTCNNFFYEIGYLP